MKELSLPGMYLHTPQIHADDRGQFLELFRGAEFAADLGHPLTLAQANVSVSRRGTIRGVHYAAVPPGQAKYLSCVSGALLLVAVDIRVGSPTFGRSEAVILDAETRRAVYLAEGLGNSFMALSETATLVYLCSQPYAPHREHAVHPLDPALALPWPADLEPVLSPKDAEAPSLAEALRTGLLPDYAACLAYTESLRATGRIP